MNYASEPYLKLSLLKLVNLLLIKDLKSFFVKLDYEEGLVIKSESDIIYARVTAYTIYDARLEYHANPHIMCVSIFLNPDIFYDEEKQEVVKTISEDAKQLTTDDFIIKYH